MGVQGRGPARSPGRFDWFGLAAALLVVLAGAWGWVLTGAGVGMSAVDMTAMAGMDGWLMRAPVWTPGYAALILVMWWVMMVAMMLPSALPMLLLFARVDRRDRTGPVPLVPTLTFAAGYGLVWGGFSLGATALQWGLESLRLLSPMLETSNRWLGAGILLAAGLWQSTPLKLRCLGQCRSPLSFLVEHWRAGRLGAVRMGLAHGAHCLGCCWFLMALLFVGGVMNLFWIVGLALYVLLEKTIPHGRQLARVTGLALIAWGFVLALQAL
jgi:predicted metal-binding membrane protein